MMKLLKDNLTLSLNIIFNDEKSNESKDKDKFKEEEDKDRLYNLINNSKKE